TADLAAGRRLGVAAGGFAGGAAGLSGRQRRRFSAVLVGQAQRPQGPLAHAGNNLARYRTAGWLAGYPGGATAVPPQDPQGQLPDDPVADHCPAPAGLAGQAGAGRALSLAVADATAGVTAMLG